MSEFEGHTPGPWRWEINPEGRVINLCGGKPLYDLTVLGFKRWGMNGAQPVVMADDHGMHLLTEAENFKVIQSGREHHASWFQLMDHPDLNLMAAAPTLLRERDEARASAGNNEHDANCWRSVKETASNMLSDPKVSAESKKSAAGFLAFLLQAEEFTK